MNKVQAELWESSHPLSEMRSEAQKSVVSFGGLLVRIVSSPALGRILQDIDGEGLDEPSRRFWERAKRAARRSGAFLNKEDRKGYREMDDQPEALQEEFRENLAGAEGMVCDCDGEGESDKVERFVADGLPVQTLAPKHEADVECAYKATYSLAPQNEQVIQHMVELRYKRARLLGYSNFVEYALEADTLVDPNTIRNELAEASKRAAPLAEREMSALSDAMSTKGQDLKAWNFQEARMLLLENRIPEAEDATRRSLSYATVVAGLLRLIGDVFSLTFRKVTEAKAWHASVQVYEVFDHHYECGGSPRAERSSDSSRHLLGRSHLDLVSRPDRQANFRTFPLFPGLAGSGLLTEVCLGGSFVDKDTLCFDFANVESLLHELGRCVYILVAQQSRYKAFNPSEDATAFQEIPGRLLRELLRQETVVERILKEAGGSISTKGREPLLTERAIDHGMVLLEQILYSIICLDLHTNVDSDGHFEGETKGLVSRLHNLYGNFSYIEGTQMQHSFTDLSENDCRYYTNVRNSMIAKRLAQKFVDTPASDVSSIGRRFRKVVLEPGLAKNAEDLLREFLEDDTERDTLRWINA